IKRRDVADELIRRHQKNKVESQQTTEAQASEAGVGWFLEIVANACGKAPYEIRMQSRVDELGFDSLTFTEFAAALEAAGVHLPEGVVFMGAVDVAALYDLATGKRHNPALEKREPRRRDAFQHHQEGDIRLPAPLQRLGKRGLAAAQKLFYTRALQTKVRGHGHVPQHTHFIVAANHSSHLDMGAVKVALGDAGRDLASLAAADYFFSNRWRRAYFANLTNLVPMERSGSVRKSLAIAEGVLRRGRSLMLFPEGTRARGGVMADFLPSLGYLALRADVGILPAYIRGTHESLPVGATIPKKRDLEVHFGTFLSIDFLRELIAGLSDKDSWRLCSALTQRIVENLRDGVTTRFDVASVRAAWNGEKLGPLAHLLRAVEDGQVVGEGGESP
ncbi:MAG TPA: 1-acyl-sn-glycerol-3-phosphate acyltransferase, partial [Polyangia bacterium]|nr:1-acyl-sn-glycerol-3-phosphate acyltransferase [Polyangia bacterium]